MLPNDSRNIAHRLPVHSVIYSLWTGTNRRFSMRSQAEHMRTSSAPMLHGHHAPMSSCRQTRPCVTKNFTARQKFCSLSFMVMSSSPECQRQDEHDEAHDNDRYWQTHHLTSLSRDPGSGGSSSSK